MKHDSRKITSDKFTVTLPKGWRDSHNLCQGDTVIPYYSEGTPLTLLPESYELSELETVLLELLVLGPSPDSGRKLIERLEKAKVYLEGALHATS